VIINGFVIYSAYKNRINLILSSKVEQLVNLTTGNTSSGSSSGVSSSSTSHSISSMNRFGSSFFEAHRDSMDLITLSATSFLFLIELICVASVKLPHLVIQELSFAQWSFGLCALALLLAEIAVLFARLLVQLDSLKRHHQVKHNVRCLDIYCQMFLILTTPTLSHSSHPLPLLPPSPTPPTSPYSTSIMWQSNSKLLSRRITFIYSICCFFLSFFFFFSFIILSFYTYDTYRHL
jgi:hypothetical protein